MFEPFIIALVLLILLGILLVRLYVVIIPARRVALVERLGSFSRILYPGVHLVWWPVECLKTVYGTYVGDDNRQKVLTQQFLPMDQAELNPPPIRCVTSNNVKVSLDVTMFYSLTDAQLFAYESQDMLNEFSHTAVQGMRQVVSHLAVGDLRGREDALGAQICDYINDHMKGKGIKAKTIRIEDIAIDDQIVKAEQDIAVKQRQQAFLMDQEQATHQRNMAQLEQKRAVQLKEAELAREAQEAALKLELLKAQAEAEKKALASKSQVDRERLLIDAGFTTQDILEWKRIEAMSAIAKSDNKVVYYAPMDYWTSGELRVRKTIDK